MPVFVESAVLLMVAWHEDFLGSLVATATRSKEPEFRAHLAAAGRQDEKTLATTCDLRTLLSLARRRISFRKRGKSIEAIFSQLLGFPAWPSETVRNRLVDLNLIRQLIVHSGGATVGDEYFNQLTDQSLLTTKQYPGLPAIRRLDHARILSFMLQMAATLKEHVDYLRREMLKRPEWTYQSPTDQKS
jgi:hypothetical protein